MIHLKLTLAEAKGLDLVAEEGVADEEGRSPDRHYHPSTWLAINRAQQKLADAIALQDDGWWIINRR